MRVPAKHVDRSHKDTKAKVRPPTRRARPSRIDPAATYRVPVSGKAGTVHALVTGADLHLVLGYRWSWHNGYAVQRGGSDWLRMHRVILGLGAFRDDPRQGDHINGDRLDNRRENLRIVTGAQQQQNLGLRSDNRSGYRGVYAERGRWRAETSLNGRKHHLGRYDTPEEASDVVERWRAEHMPYSVRGR